MQFTCDQTIVEVNDLRTEAFVGEHAAEREQLQVISISIKCMLENPEVKDDDLANSVNYVPIVEAVKKLAVEKKRALIETLAEEISEVCFTNPLVSSVVVSVQKPHKLPSVAAVGIQRTFSRR